ncbi:hypothetical protein [Spirosoma sp.]|uniref:hypothetical protein n=1 Tax=Spirosoma sp. TaxID=1899569 RepID=UPI003B3B6A71
MLFKQTHLQGIQEGTVTLAFRKWKRAAIQNGTLLHTAVGLIKITGVRVIDEKDITERDAREAGFTDRQHLLKSFTHNKDGVVFRMSVAYHSKDPRIELREQSILTEETFEQLKVKLQRLDTRSKQGSWTMNVLQAIQKHPHVHALGISALTGFDKDWLKLNIRKLKNLGLTISHTVGYEIAPFGELFLTKMKDQKL